MDEASEDENRGSRRAWKLVMVGLPAFLALSSVAAMLLWWKRAEEPAPDPRLALAASEVREEEVADHLYKLDDLIGRRDWTTPAGRTAIRRTIKFLEGTLSPQNYGFSVERGNAVTNGEERWPTLWVDVPGSAAPREVVLVAVAYDLAAGPVAEVLGALNDLRDDGLERTLRFAFFPAGLLEGGDLATLLTGDESMLGTVVPEQPEEGERRSVREVVSRARELIRRVREIGAVDGKMP